MRWLPIVLQLAVAKLTPKWRSSPGLLPVSRSQRDSNSTNTFLALSRPYYTRPEDFSIPSYNPNAPRIIAPPTVIHTGSLGFFPPDAHIAPPAPQPRFQYPQNFPYPYDTPSTPGSPPGPSTVLTALPTASSTASSTSPALPGTYPTSESGYSQPSTRAGFLETFLAPSPLPAAPTGSYDRGTQETRENYSSTTGYDRTTQTNQKSSSSTASYQEAETSTSSYATTEANRELSTIGLATSNYRETATTTGPANPNAPTSRIPTYATSSPAYTKPPPESPTFSKPDYPTPSSGYSSTHSIYGTDESQTDEEGELTPPPLVPSVYYPTSKAPETKIPYPPGLESTVNSIYERVSSTTAAGAYSFPTSFTGHTRSTSVTQVSVSKKTEEESTSSYQEEEDYASTPVSEGDSYPSREDYQTSSMVASSTAHNPYFQGASRTPSTNGPSTTGSGYGSESGRDYGSTMAHATPGHPTLISESPFTREPTEGPYEEKYTKPHERPELPKDTDYNFPLNVGQPDNSRPGAYNPARPSHPAYSTTSPYFSGSHPSSTAPPSPENKTPTAPSPSYSTPESPDSGYYPARPSPSVPAPVPPVPITLLPRPHSTPQSTTEKSPVTPYRTPTTDSAYPARPAVPASPANPSPSRPAVTSTTGYPDSTGSYETSSPSIPSSPSNPAYPAPESPRDNSPSQPTYPSSSNHPRPSSSSYQPTMPSSPSYPSPSRPSPSIPSKPSYPQPTSVYNTEGPAPPSGPTPPAKPSYPADHTPETPMVSSPSTTAPPSSYEKPTPDHVATSTPPYDSPEGPLPVPRGGPITNVTCKDCTPSPPPVTVYSRPGGGPKFVIRNEISGTPAAPSANPYVFFSSTNNPKGGDNGAYDSPPPPPNAGNTTGETGKHNRVKGMAHLLCVEDGVEVRALTVFPFEGSVSAIVEGGQRACTKEFAGDTTNVTVFLSYDECGTKGGGDAWQMQVVFSFPNDEMSFTAVCEEQKIRYEKKMLPRRLEESLEELKLIPIRIEQKAPMPELLWNLTEGDQTEASRTVDIGSSQVMSFSLNPETDAYGLLVRDCYVIDEKNGDRHEVIDANGCSSDMAAFAHPNYDTYHDVVRSDWMAFKLPDHTHLKVECSVTVCPDIPSSDSNMTYCTKIASPPFCPRMGPMATNSLNTYPILSKRSSVDDDSSFQRVEAALRLQSPRPKPLVCLSPLAFALPIVISSSTLFAALLLHCTRSSIRREQTAIPL